MTDFDFSIFNQRKILVTGHTGFKGSWLTIWLLLLKAKVIGYSLAPKTSYDNYCLSSIKNNIKEYIADIREKEKVLDIVNTEQPEIIFHLAAQPLVLDSYLQPLYTIETNVLGTANILEAFRNSSSAKLLIVITTDKVYENKEIQMPFVESDRLGGKDTYSASKASAELLVKAYDESFFKQDHNKKIVATVRAGNVIGGGDWSDHRIIPDCIKAIENDKDIILRNPNFVRPWQFVLEPLCGYLMLAAKILNGETNLNGAWNFGPSNQLDHKVIDLVNLIIKYFGKGHFIITNSKTSFMEEKYLSLDNSKSKEKLKWKPCLSLEESVQLTVDWYKNYKNTDMFQFCAEQIYNYEKLWRLRN